MTATTWTRQFTVDAMGAALMISEFARRHIARQATWGRIIGLTSGSMPGRNTVVTESPPMCQLTRLGSVNNTMGSRAAVFLPGAGHLRAGGGQGKGAAGWLS